MVSTHGPPFSKIVESTSDGIDGPWMVTRQGGMVDDWWQSAPGKIAAPPTLIWEWGGGVRLSFPYIRYMLVSFTYISLYDTNIQSETSSLNN